MERDKRAKFVELAEKRVNRVIHDLRLVGNLANRNNYVYDDEDAQRIVAAIEEEVRILKKRFQLSATDGAKAFKLRGDE
jgi:hypothetical protein